MFRVREIGATQVKKKKNTNEHRRMTSWIFLLFATCFTSVYGGNAPVTCQRTFSKIGCFKEVNSRPDLALKPMTLEIIDRDIYSKKYQGYLIGWNNMEASVHSLACRCANTTRSLGMNYFSLRFWGECWIGKTDIAKLIVTLQNPKWQSTKCVNSWSFRGVCDHKHEKECVAKAGSGYIYFLEDKTKTEENIDGGYSEWSTFSECSATCGFGLMERERTCTNPVPLGRGKDCSVLGPMSDSKPCIIKECPVNGGLSEWTTFGTCSKSCGGGISVRTRSCTNPSPSNGGKDCSESTQETKHCATEPCPIDGNYGEWSSWETCSADCGDGFHKQERECNNPKPQFGGKTCDLLGLSQESRTCKIKECPIDGGFGSWSGFSECSKLCGNGLQTRTRKCDQPEPAHGGKDCIGIAIESNECKIVDCPIDGKWGEWEPFSACSQTCGSAYQSRKRTCTNPAPQYGGQACDGPDTMTALCPLTPCPVDGGYGSWSGFGACSKDCGQGTQTRTRYCDSPSPANGGRNCDVLGPSSEQIGCYTQCPTQSSVACEAEDLNINCYGRGTIQVTAANYGRRVDHICTRLPNRWNRNCGNEWNSRNIVSSRCQNQVACSVRAGNEVFGDQCWGVYKYLEVQYYCSG